MGGYKHQVEELFEFNPGFQSRFDKMRIEFPAWTGKQASDALIQMIERDGKVITEVAKQGIINHHQYIIIIIMIIIIIIIIY